MSEWETIYRPTFKVLGNTLWWTCPACQRMVHVTRNRPTQHGADFPCTYDHACDFRHSVEWLHEENALVTIYSYHKHISDKSGLPFLARVL